MPNYANGKIYTIRSRSCDLVYIGSTTQSLSDRLSTHKRNFKTYKNGKYGYMASFQLLEKGDAYIELFEDYPCNNNDELRRREGQCQRKYECVNLNIAGRTQAEYYKEKREQLLEQKKQYYEENKEMVLEKVKKYYQNNKEKIAEKHKIKVTCEVCGSTVRKNDIARHRKSKKHQAALV